jgi:hypothetical protein
MSWRLLSQWLLITLVAAALAVLPDAADAPKPEERISGQEEAPPPSARPSETQPLLTAAQTAERSQLFLRLLAPFADEAAKRRAERAASDPQYLQRIDQQLNRDRLNFLLYGYGETHEPPRTERAFIGSITIVSINLATRTIDLVSLTHDIRAPEVERYLQAQGQPTPNAVKIDRAYPVGGFDLMRETLENATGLAIDFQVAFRDTILIDLVDSVFDGVEVEVPMDFAVAPFYVDGIKFDAGSFSRGRQTLNGLQVVQFIKTVPGVPGHGAYPPILEHNARKHLVFRGLLESFEDQACSLGFWVSALQFLLRERKAGALDYDFDLRSLLVGNIKNAFTLQRLSCEGDGFTAAIGKTIYIVDPAHGQGGVQWVTSDPNPVTRRDIQQGVYPGLAFAVPYNANPYSDDLVRHYWPSVRQRIKALLTN